MAARLDTSSHCRAKRGRNLTCRFTTAWTRRHQHRIGRRARPTLTTANGTESAITVRRSGSLSEQKSSGVFTPKLESGPVQGWLDRKSTRLNSSHTVISYAVFCLKKKKVQTVDDPTARRRSARTRSHLKEDMH